MSDSAGYDFTEEQAAKIVKMLQDCTTILADSVAYAYESGEEAAAFKYRDSIANVLFDLGWEVLEQGFYNKHPQLRPPESAPTN